MEDRCVSCGAIIPEGRQVCKDCERGETKLKPCPFCGNKAKNKKFRSKGILRKTTVFYVECPICKCRTSMQLTQEEAETIWNRRTDNE